MAATLHQPGVGLCRKRNTHAVRIIIQWIIMHASRRIIAAQWHDAVQKVLL